VIQKRVDLVFFLSHLTLYPMSFYLVLHLDISARATFSPHKHSPESGGKKTRTREQTERF
jgi:hypothetical protein